MQNKVATKRYFDKKNTKKFDGKKQKPEGRKSKETAAKKFAGVKRKPEDVVKENGDSSPKRMKLESFPGTGKLKGKKESLPKQEGKGPLAPPSNDESMTRAQRKRLRHSTRRRASRKTFANIVETMKKGDTSIVEDIKAKIADIKSRETLTNTARRKLKRFQGALKMVGAVSNPSVSNKEATAEKKVQKKTIVQKQKGTKKVEKLAPPAKTFVDDDDEGDSDEAEDESDYDVEQTIKPGTISKKMNDDKEDEDDDSAEEEEESTDEEGDSSNANDSKGEFISLEPEEEEESGEEEEASDEEGESGEEENEEDEDNDEEIPKVVAKNKNLQNRQNGSPQKGKSRYVAFVGNLPYDVTKAQIMEHFKKAGEIQDVRLMMDPNTQKSRGFAYVEVKNQDSYQKALSLHNTFLGGRKIKVEYTQGGKKKGENAKKEIKAKNMKFKAMRKQGKFPGGKNESQKRAERRKRQTSK